MHLGDVVSTIPTIGFNVETLSYKNFELTVWDVGGQERIRPLWRHYYLGTQGIIFVVDASDRTRAQQEREELQKLLAQAEMRGAKVLIMANKQDLPHAVAPVRVAEGLGLQNAEGGGPGEIVGPIVCQQEWHIQGCSAVNGEGLFDGLEWLCQALTTGEHK